MEKSKCVQYEERLTNDEPPKMISTPKHNSSQVAHAIRFEKPDVFSLNLSKFSLLLYSIPNPCGYCRWSASMNTEERR